jgi:hypothetical protein
MLPFVDDQASVARAEARLPFRNPGAQLVGIDGVLLYLEQRHVAV